MSFGDHYWPSIKLIAARAKGTGLRDFDLNYLQAFLINMPVYPVGTKVKLNTREFAFVIRNNPKTVLRPIVLVTTNPYGQPLHTPFELDLMSRTDVIINLVNC